MKRIFFIFSILAVVTSCLGGSTLNMSGTSMVHFDLADGSYMKDSIYYDTLGARAGFAFEYLAFYHKVDEEPTEFRGGFMASRLVIPASGNTEGLDNKYRVNSKATIGGTNKFAVFTQTADMPEKHIEFMYRSAGIVATCSPVRMQVNNTLEVAEAIQKAFGPGNKLNLTAKGYKNGQKEPTGEAVITLAERMEGKDSIVSTWTLFDLSKLGSIDEIRLNIETVPEGLDIPKAVCLDNLIVNVSLVSE